MFQRVDEARFLAGEHDVLRFWDERGIFRKLIEKNRGKPKWSFLDGPITANNPMGVHHAWGRTYKDAYQRYFAMTGHELRYQNGFDCQGLWVEVEVEKELKLGTKTAIQQYGIDKFVWACKQRVLRFAARQTEQSIRLGYWMEWDHPDELRKLAEAIGEEARGTRQEGRDKNSLNSQLPTLNYRTARNQTVTAPAEEIVAKLGNPEWGGSYFTFSTENNETIWSFLKKCFDRKKIYMGHDVMPWGGRAGSAYSQMEIADGRKLTTHRSCFVRFPIVEEREGTTETRRHGGEQLKEYLLVWTTTPWTLTSNVAAAVNPDLEYVRLKGKAKGDEEPAYFYFAKDNLEYKRLEKEFKEGFGGEASWPNGVPKLKTIAQLFKEQGGYEIEGTLKGAEMVGWSYAGPFDDLDAQQTAFDSKSRKRKRPEASLLHPVIDGGRDNKGNANVVAGEGTGIVHIAPGCGDVDHKIGIELGLPIIAPLKEDGTYGEGFGEFTGREAINPETADLVFERLKEKGLLVYVETYPHIYPHCWRTGEELVFRLVDEWFINMDWREEIKDVTKTINWLPASVQGEERELEWLTTMRDWMISKKRFWGLALPIWVNPDDPTDFEVVGSLAELKERATNGGEGWDEFEGHTPHRPWIDRVKLPSQKHPGQLLKRIEDVGNPWLDAGIVPFSTLNFNGRYPNELLNWDEWFPADFVVECFPGQFRNWFYSLLSLATMMRYDQTDEAVEKRPFKNLLGHRLVMDELGRPMHKSDGTAIWFEEAAEQLGVDTLRWMYLAQPPASDLRFGLRDKDQPVALETVDGPIAQTKEGLPTCKVTSTPADEVRRQVLIPLWNSYAFFVNYAILDGFDPTLEQVPLAERPEIDRWVLSRLQELIVTAHESFQAFDAARFMQAAAAYIDDLSNWYIRRNRRRFWRARSTSGEGQPSSWEADKLAAYQTLHEVLVTLTKLLAPAIPFLTERMYQNLVGSSVQSPVSSVKQSATRNTLDSQHSTLDTPESVHLCEYPTVDPAKLDPQLNWATQQVQTLVTMGHRLRETAEQRVRQPLAELRFATSDARQAAALEKYADVIADELNVKTVVRAADLDDLVSYLYKPNLKTLGPKFGKRLGEIKSFLERTATDATLAASLAPLRRGESVEVTPKEGADPLTLAPQDVLVSTQQATDWASADAEGIQVALSTRLTPDLVREGMARDLIRHVQQLRKESNLNENARIHVQWSAEGTADESLQAMLSEWSETICKETRADGIESRAAASPERQVSVGEVKVSITVTVV